MWSSEREMSSDGGFCFFFCRIWQSMECHFICWLQVSVIWTVCFTMVKLTAPIVITVHAVFIERQLYTTVLVVVFVCVCMIINILIYFLLLFGWYSFLFVPFIYCISNCDPRSRAKNTHSKSSLESKFEAHTHHTHTPHPVSYTHLRAHETA